MKKIRYQIAVILTVLCGPMANATTEPMTNATTEERIAESVTEAETTTPVANRPAHALYLEFNKLEQREDLCVAYVRFRNDSPVAFDEFKSEMFAFDRDDVITAHFALDFQQVPAAKTMVKLFPMKNTRCDEVGSVLLNKMVSCRSSGVEVEQCLQSVETASKVPLRLYK